MKKRTAKRAVRIAAVVMARAEMCVLDDPDKCPECDTEDVDGICANCIRTWLLNKAREEVRGC